MSVGAKDDFGTSEQSTAFSIKQRLTREEPNERVHSLRTCRLPGDVLIGADQGDPHARLIGTTVMAEDGAAIGEVTDVKLDDGGRPIAVRMRAGVRLGFGARTIELPRRSFTIVRGAVVVNLPREAVEMLVSVDKDTE